MRNESDWVPTKLDLVLSVVIGFGFPFLANVLFVATGALLPMLIYYGMAWGIVKWRRGSSGYSLKIDHVPKLFYVNTLVIIISLIFAFYARIVAEDYSIGGIIVTALIWAPANAASEQLLWIYLFESWDLYQPSSDIENSSNSSNPSNPSNPSNSSNPSNPKQTNWANRIIGLLIFTSYVGMIHTLYWVEFLHTVSSSGIIGIIFVLGTTVSGYLHILVWREGKNMLFTFIPHFILNLVPLFWTYYSMLPYLWN